LVFIISIGLFGCTNQKVEEDKNVEEKTWEEIVKDARGTTVNFYGWGGDQRINQWIEEVVGPLCTYEV